MLIRLFSPEINDVYMVTRYDTGEEAEFCQNGTLKIAVYCYDLTYFYNSPDIIDLELLYTKKGNWYIPILNNGRLV